MTTLSLIVLTAITWLLPLIKLKGQQDGLKFFFKNLGINLLLIALAIGLAYILAGFNCDTQYCEQRYMVIGLVSSSIFSMVWAVILFAKASNR